MSVELAAQIAVVSLVAPYSVGYCLLVVIKIKVMYCEK